MSTEKPIKPVTGADYVATTRLSKGKTVFAEPGQTCERVPPVSFPWLIAQKLIVAVEKKK